MYVRTCVAFPLAAISITLRDHPHITSASRGREGVKIADANKGVARIFGRGSAIWSEATNCATCFAGEAA